MAGQLDRGAIPQRDDYAARFGLALIGRGKNVMGPCGVHGGTDSASFHADGPWQCFACGAKGGDMLDYHRQVHGISLPAAARELGAWIEGDGKRPAPAPARPVARPKTQEPAEPFPYFARKLWDESLPLAGTTGAEYLVARRCVLPPEDSDLRFHPAVRHPSGHTLPALLGLITHAVTREPMGVQRIWHKADGTKAADPAKMTLGAKQGGVVRIWPDDTVCGRLAIAEGTETALSVAHAFSPVWSLLDAGNLAAFPVLRGIEFLLIARDNDAAGIKAADACAARWAAAGCSVHLTQQAANDLNDVIREAA
jgi:putative DNA primase/helicase